jgi:hypothetical protein
MGDETTMSTDTIADFAGFQAVLERATRDIGALKGYAEAEAVRLRAEADQYRDLAAEMRRQRDELQARIDREPTPPSASPLDVLLGRVQQSGGKFLPADSGILAGIGLAVVMLIKSYEPVFAAQPGAPPDQAPGGPIDGTAQ